MSTLGDINPTVANIVTKQIPPPLALNLFDFIPQTEWAAIHSFTSSYDCLSAMNNAIAALIHLNPGLGGGVGGGRIDIPPGGYLFSGTININEVFVWLQGAGSGEAGGPATELAWTADVTGIHVYHDVGTGGSGSASRIDGFLLYGARPNSTLGTACGIDAGERVIIEHCVIQNFSAHGINIVASVPGGNANNWYINKVRVYSNNGHGIFTYGTDVNAGTCISASVSTNGGWGIWDSSFLGNTWVGAHAETNGLGPYHCDNQNARNIWIGCYSEMDQPPSQLAGPAIVLGGLHAAGISSDSSARQIGVFGSDTGFNTVSAAAGIDRPITVHWSNYGNLATMEVGAIGMSAGDSNTYAFKWWDETHGVFADVIDYSNGGSGMMWTTTLTGISDVATGSAVPAGRLILPKTFYQWPGPGGAARKLNLYQSADVAPTSGDWVVGDIIFNTTATAGGFIGWVCTTAGAAGSGAVFKTFGAISA